MVIWMAGKTFFLYFALVERLLDALPTALQLGRDDIFLFQSDGVRLLPAAANIALLEFLHTITPRIWALVDSNATLNIPAEMFISHTSPFYVVQATSPKLDRWKEWKKQRKANEAVLQPWSWDELCIGAYVSGPYSCVPLLMSYSSHQSEF